MDLFGRTWDSPTEAARAINAVLGRSGLPAKGKIRTALIKDVSFVSDNVEADHWVASVAADGHDPECSLYVEGASAQEIAEFSECHADARSDEDCDDEIQYEWRLEDDGFHLEAIHIHCVHH
ncbi:MAG: hypothetical protein F4087_09105 [Gemmatimonadetes bacterium]|nr:hypothetical protein [Gemmatimonadota bacterium]